MRKGVQLAALIFGVYLVIRAIVELFVIDFGDPASYRDDWGGPSLAGVLAVHCGPGLVAAVVIIVMWQRRRQRRARG